MSAVQRWTASDPCPVCGEHERSALRGMKTRCWGFLSSDRQYAHCTREDLAGAIEIKTNSRTYPHRLGGDCRCGVSHGVAAASYQQRGRPRNKTEHAVFETVDQVLAFYRKRLGPEGWQPAAQYLYEDESSQPVLLVLRFERCGEKTFRQASHRPSGWALHPRRPR